MILEKTPELTEACRIGPVPKGDKEDVPFDRVTRWAPHGFEYEADPRHAETIVGELNLLGAKTLGAPGAKVMAEAIASGEGPSRHHHTAFRGVAARCNYLAPDWPDIQSSAHGVCR